ncbi:retrovirus-related Pol polyprotein from type-1 retrotransposable element R2 [Caerostris extrusa]|uniref:Retrovirus-related Pol polyprotein from type-1 retrotransposable element R2 n=1 Tax=Caerostris extrusa TaxID=172846 RepID=A0AAV4WRU4_CAEEX|nr:retrovirus-related Pol polyprotein from type-1 retrotransposable element R2 [Caerostris extrusa]
MSAGPTCGQTLLPRWASKFFIVDITCRFEGDDYDFTAAWEAKCSKYEPLFPLYQAQGLTATVVPFLVGALGSWYPWNDKFLKRFCAKSYLALFRKLCVSNNIKWARDIYIEHITGHRQYLVDDASALVDHAHESE